jgi:Domain of unknown function (DUF4118)
METFPSRALGRTMVLVGPAAAALIAWATSTTDDDIGIANTALALAFVCVAAALAQPVAGVTTSLAAALALNYFHTEPVHSLRMNDSGEIVTVLLLMVLGLSVSVVTTMRVRSRVNAHLSDASEAATAQLVDSLHRGAPLPAAPTGMPVVSNRAAAGAADVDVVVVPEAGACMTLDTGGAIVLVPQVGMGSVTISRLSLRQFAEHVTSVLGAATGAPRAA